MAAAFTSHCGEALADEVHRAEVVYLKLSLLLRVAHVLDNGTVGDPGVVDQNIYRSDRLFYFPHQSRGRLVVGNIERLDCQARALGDGLCE